MTKNHFLHYKYISFFVSIFDSLIFCEHFLCNSLSAQEVCKFAYQRAGYKIKKTAPPAMGSAVVFTTYVVISC